MKVKSYGQILRNWFHAALQKTASTQLILETSVYEWICGDLE